MTDPFLLSSDENSAEPTALADRIDELARTMNVSRTRLEGATPDVLDLLEHATSRLDACWELWSDLADSLAGQLTAAGFQRHDPLRSPGGYHLYPCEEGVLLTWSTTEYPDDYVSPFEKMVENIVQPALIQLIQALGFTAAIVPEGHDDSGNILVTSGHEPQD